jgi:glycosyltransferase involved in cell wall biosynthesis
MTQQATLLFLTNSTEALRCYWQPLLAHMQAAGWRVLCCVPHAALAAGQKPFCPQGCTLLGYPLDAKGCSAVHDARTVWALRAIMRQERPQMVLAATIKSVIYGGIAAQLAAVPQYGAIITGLGYAFEGDTVPKRLLRWFVSRLYGFALRRAGIVFFQNSADAEEFSQRGILSREQPKALCKGAGVDCSHFSPAPAVIEKPVFLLVARLLVAKGIAVFAQAAQQLKQRYPQARFCLLGQVMQGRGALDPAELCRWQQAGDIEYWGSCRDVRPFVRQASVLVLPSWREGTPASILEGMAMGRAAVVSDVPGCRDAVREGINGFLVPPRDSVALALALEKFIQEPALIERMGQAARRIACDEFDANTVAEGMVARMPSC